MLRNMILKLLIFTFAKLINALSKKLYFTLNLVVLILFKKDKF